MFPPHVSPPTVFAIEQLRHRLRAVWHPERYHGWGRTRNYFEGWYYKLVDPTEQYALAFIPGISYDARGEGHAFVQVLEGKALRTHYIDFPTAQFRPAADRFDVRVGESRFHAAGLDLALPGFSGTLSFDKRHPWTRQLGAPGIMGWYGFVPFMECYHDVISLHHRLRGTLRIHGTEVDFTGGIGYLEKDWGRRFPSSWVWLQTNHFDHAEPISVMASVARIPWLGQHFIGHIVGFWFGGELHRFATYTGSKFDLNLDTDRFTLTFRSGRKRLVLRARVAAGGTLVSPNQEGMHGKINESMQSEVAVAFYVNDELRFSGTGRNAGLEVSAEAARELAGHPVE